MDFVFSLLRNPLKIHKKYSSASQCLVGSGWEPREDLGGWGRTLLLRAPPPADPKGPLLYYLELSIFGWLTLKFFSKRFRRQNILILMEERAPKKCDFLNKKISWLFGLGLKKFDCSRKFGQIGVFKLIWERSENQFGRPKKRSTN